MLSKKAVAQTTIDRNSLTKITWSEAKKIVEIDSKLDHAGDEYVCEDNIFTYYVLINTWLLQFDDMSKRYAGVEVLEHIKQSGLIDTINLCQNVSDMVISNLENHTFLASLTTQVTPENIGWVLQLLRYPKRLSPAGCDKLQANSIGEFKDRERMNKRKMRRSETYAVRRVFNDARTILSVIPDMGDRPDLCEFTSGATVTGVKALAPRVAEALTGYPDLFGYGYGVFTPTTSLPDYAQVEAVPKSYKARRIIAKEHPGRQYKLSAVANYLWEQMKCKMIPGTRLHFCDRFVMDDQRINQAIAEIGSHNGKYCTIDFSAASDSITYAEACSILPCWLVARIRQYRPEKLRYADGSMATQQMWLSSGNKCTFICEGAIFLAVTIAIIRIYDTYCHTQCSREVFVYGDDVIIPTECFEFYMDYISAIGWKINPDKSFATTGDWVYRESCGVEFLNGHPCDTHYFTRKTLQPGKSSIAILVDMQHKLYEYEGVRLWLTSLARTIFPGITTSPYGDETATDLWGYSEPVLRKLPCAKFVQKVRTFRYLKLKERSTVLQALPCNETETIHSRPQTLSSGSKQTYSGWTEQEQRAAYEMYCYVTFLQHGPRYLTELDKLLGVSAPYDSYDKACRNTKVDYIL